MLMDVHQRGNLRFPQSLPEFQRLFPDDAACAAYLEKARWSDGFVCPHCQAAGEPFRFANRPGVLRCRKCRRDIGLTVGTVMARSHYLVSSQTPGVSAVQLRRQLGLSRYETAFQILHKLRAGMVRPDQDRIGGRPGEHVEGCAAGPSRVHPGVTATNCRASSSSERSGRAERLALRLGFISRYTAWPKLHALETQHAKFPDYAVGRSDACRALLFLRSNLSVSPRSARKLREKSPESVRSPTACTCANRPPRPHRSHQIHAAPRPDSHCTSVCE